MAQVLFDLHKQYGDIVRIGPNELHFGRPSAFHEIYNAARRWDKDEALYGTPGIRSGSFVLLKYHHAKERRNVLQPMFSKKAILNIEYLVWRNVSKESMLLLLIKLTIQAKHLVSSMTNINAAGQSVDLLYAFRSFTLDTIMCFTFGTCMGALNSPGFADPLIVAMNSSLRALPILKNFPLIRKIAYSIPHRWMMKMLPGSKSLAPRIYHVWAIIQDQLDQILQDPRKLDEAPHQTIFHQMLNPEAHRSKSLPNHDELQEEGVTLIFAGASTVADAILIGHWHLLNQPKLLRRLKSEVLAVWPDISSPPSLEDLETLPLLTATIKESLRHIPSGVSLTRVVPSSGAMISGQKIPAGAIVGMAILHVHFSEEKFKDPLSFTPDRWLEQPDSANLDHWLVPFSRGPRMCFGTNLAWCELYIAFATTIRQFDMAIDGTTPQDMEWRECIAAYYPRRHLHAWCQPTIP
ncbi:hypothetical protein LOZ54_000125 [Ophidiomyces ophidiicola]|nr:hypothetical protein LOZ54_000125 [Ophidiomyces ophidiicola]